VNALPASACDLEVPGILLGFTEGWGKKKNTNNDHDVIHSNRASVVAGEAHTR
jgi:hypothetical protein